MTQMKMDTLTDVLSQVEEIYRHSEKDLTGILHRELLLNALKCKRDDLEILDLKVLRRAISEFRYAARIFKPYRKTRKVSIFGSARTREDDPHFKMAVEFARLLAQDDFMVITGAADGIMKAGNIGAGAAKSFGVNILLPFEQSANEVILDDPKLITFKYFFTRKLFFLMEAHGVALFPGGFGTHDEGFETLTLVQTGKAPPMPLLLMETPESNYWIKWDEFVREQLLSRELISPEDVSLYKICNSPQAGIDWVIHFYSTFHSVRQVRNRLVLRLEKAVTDEHVERLNDTYSDIVVKGRIEKTAALPQEANEPDLRDKPRLVFHFDRSRMARLNQMILEINELGKTV